MRQKTEYNVLSPDGFPIFRELTYPSKKKAFDAFNEWKERFVAQGYYSSTSGRIELGELADNCTLVKFHPESGMFLPAYK